MLEKQVKVEIIGFCLIFSRGDDGPRRFNRVGEDDVLKQKKQTKQVQISRLIKFISRLVID